MHGGHHGHGGPGGFGPGGPMGFGGPGFGPGGPPPPGPNFCGWLCDSLCMWCCWCCYAPPPLIRGPPPPPPAPIIMQPSIHSPVVATPPVEARPVYKEIRSLELVDGGPISRFFLTISPEVVYNQPTKLMVGNKQVTVVIPETFARGEKVIVLAPGEPKH